MALFHPNLVQLMREKLFTDLGTSGARQAYDISTVKLISFHSGNQPTANEVVTNWASTYNSSKDTFLALTDMVSFSESKNGTGTDYSYILSNVVTGNYAIRSGTATWAIIYEDSTLQSITSATLTATSTVPANVGLMVVPVSDVNTSTGVFKLLNNNLIGGSTFTITDFTLTFDVA